MVGEDTNFLMSWETNQEFLQIGGLGWGSDAGEDSFTNPFSGDIADVQIFDQVLDGDEIQTLAGISSFEDLI